MTPAKAPRPLRFVFTTTLGGTWGGCEWLWADTARVLQQRGHRIALALPWRKDHPALRTLVENGAELHAPGAPARFWRRWLRRLQKPLPATPLLQAIESLAPDLVVVSQDRQDRGEEFAAQLAGRPYVLVNQLVADHVYWEDAAAEKIAALYRGARASYFVAAGNLRSLERNLGESLPRASVVHNPFRVPYAHPAPWPARESASLALVGRLDPDHKGHDLLLEVLSRPRWLERDWTLDFFGDGSNRVRLRRQIDRLGLSSRVRLRGHVADPAEIWTQVDVALFPSRCEGTPIALVEAMLSGRPAVATDVGGNADLVLDGRTGWLAPAAHPALLDAAMERMWADRALWRRRGEDAAAHVRTIVPPDPAAAWAGEVERVALQP